MKRRDMLVAGGLAVAGSLGGCFASSTSRKVRRDFLSFRDASWNSYPFRVEPLPYGREALIPTIDAETMELHHDRHHAGYTKKLNEVLGEYPQLQKMSCSELLSSLQELPETIRESVRNFGGGHLNHSLFWESMIPTSSHKPGQYTLPSLLRTFGTLSEFRLAFEQAGKGVFGSGWVWLVSDEAGSLSVVTTPNQDNPLSLGLIPLLGNDVWEHAYYLNYRTGRADYLTAWWNVVNWEAVEKRYLAVRATEKSV